MTKPIPDTDPLKREPPGGVSRVPHKEIDRNEQPAGKPDEQGGAATGGRPGDVQSHSDPPVPPEPREPPLQQPEPDDIPRPEQDDL